MGNSAEENNVDDADDNTFLCQANILKATVQHPLNEKYPLPDGYIYSFLKCLINKVLEIKILFHENHSQLVFA